MELVSVIIPVYNVEKYILKCLNSIVNQTYKNLEIIIINDGTEDKSIELIKDSIKDKRIKIYNRTNQGQANARNFALTKSQGKYVFYVDADDFISLDCIEKMYNIAINKNSDLVICDYYKYFDSKNFTHIKNVPFTELNDSKCYVISMPGPVCKLFKKDILTKNNIKFLEGHYFEDNAIIPYAIAKCQKIEYIPEPLYYYVQRQGSSICKKTYDKKWEDIFNALEHLYNKFKDDKLLSKYQDEVEYIYIEYLLHAANLRFIDHKEGIPNIYKVSKVMKEKYPQWRKNKYYKKTSIKYKIICNLFYYKKIKIVKILLKR